MASQKPLGVTAPISDKLPTDAEKRSSDALIEELRREKTFENPSDTELRFVSTFQPAINMTSDVTCLQA